MAVTMPIAALVALSMIIGMAVGILVALGLSVRKPKETKKSSPSGY
jgi:hypothetical protein